MSKPKFQTEWEEIDEEYQQLQVIENTRKEYIIVYGRYGGWSVSWKALTADTVVAMLVWLDLSYSPFILSSAINAALSQKLRYWWK